MPQIAPTGGRQRSELEVSKFWIQGVALVMAFGFAVMGFLALRTYTDSMPQPEQVVDSQGKVVFTGEDITTGQQIFLRRGLQQYGSIMGHGGYLGPDYTADYLRRSSTLVLDDLKSSGMQDPQGALVEMMRTNRYDEETGALQFTDEQIDAFDSLKGHYGDYFGSPTTQYGLMPNAIPDSADIHYLTAFFAWTAWAASAERPGHNYSYTNNWPSEPLVDNVPTADIIVWGTTGDRPTLYLPVDESVEVLLTSPDVIHSFWVPAFLFKMDVVPGRTNTFSFTPTVIGTFQGRCAELCGAYHSRMLFDVEVVSAEDYAAYLQTLEDKGQTGIVRGGEDADTQIGIEEEIQDDDTTTEDAP